MYSAAPTAIDKQRSASFWSHRRLLMRSEKRFANEVVHTRFGARTAQNAASLPREAISPGPMGSSRRAQRSQAIDHIADKIFAIRPKSLGAGAAPIETAPSPSGSESWEPAPAAHIDRAALQNLGQRQAWEARIEQRNGLEQFAVQGIVGSCPAQASAGNTPAAWRRQF